MDPAQLQDEEIFSQNKIEMQSYIWPQIKSDIRSLGPW